MAYFFQIQDAGNHVWQAINIISNLPLGLKGYNFNSSEHVTQVRLFVYEYFS